MSFFDSRYEQKAIESLLRSMEELAEIGVFAAYKGTTESEIDAALSGSLVRSGKRAGAVLLVAQPIEQAADATVPKFTRRYIVRVLEQVKVNTLPGGRYAAGYNCDELKDLVIQRLHNRHLGRAALSFAGTEPYGPDDKGGIGYDVSFNIQAALNTEARAANPIVGISAGTCTITGAGATGEVIYYTLDGSPPEPGAEGTQTYSAAFTVESGTIVIAATIATDEALSEFTAAKAA